MSTKRKFPDQTVPMMSKDGLVIREWYQSLVTEAHVGVPATAAAAGAASALPATPAGYLTVTVNGQQALMPYYALPP